MCVLRLFWSKLWMLILAALTGAMAASIVLTQLASVSYSCTTTFVVTSRSSGAYYSSINAAAEVAAIYSELLGSSVMEKTIETALGGERAGTISASQLGSTNLIEVTATAASPGEALLTMNAVKDNYREISDYVSSSAVLSVLSDSGMAVVPTKTADIRQTSMLCGAACAAAMACAIFWVFLSADTVQNRAGAKNRLDARIITEIPHEKDGRRRAFSNRKSSAPGLMLYSPTISFAFSESVHKIATRLENEREKGRAVFMFSSVSESEGKSTVARNTALSLAMKGGRVLFMDLDLRRPVQAELFGAELKQDNEFGALLAAQADARDILDSAVRDEKSGLFLLLSAQSYANMIELLSSGTLRETIMLARERFDYIIIDSPPLGYFSDSEVIADLSDASVLVVRQDVAAAPDINDAIDSLRACRAELLGCVLNDMRCLFRGGSSYGGYGYGAYGRYGTYGKYGKSTGHGQNVRQAE